MSPPARRPRPRRWIPLVAAGVLLPGLSTLVVLEVRWLGQLAEAQRIATERRLESAAQRIAGDLQAHLGRCETALFGSAASDRDRARARWPFVADVRPIDPESEDPAADPPAPAAFDVRADDGTRWRVTLDVARLRADLLPELARRALGADDVGSYDVGLVRVGSERAGEPDVQVELELAPNRWLDLAGGDWIQAPAAVFVAEEAAATLGSDAPTPRWRLTIRHRDGSLEAAYQRARARNLLVGGGLLALLLAGLVGLWIAEQRGRRLVEAQLAFVAGVSHELRTPLAVVRTAASNLARGTVAAPERVAEYGRLIGAEAERLSVRVERVLRFAEPDRAPVHAETFDVDAWIDEAVERCEPWRDRRPFSIEAVRSPEPKTVRGDRDALVSALHNLLENAIKYGRPQSAVRVEATLEDEELVLAVENAGEAPSARERSRLFEPFYRTPAARDGAHPGSGLGLAVARRIAERHAGRLVLAPPRDPGRPVRFELRLPRENGTDR